MYQIKNRVEVAKVGSWNDFEVTEDVLKEAAEYSQGKIPIRPGHTEIKAGEKAKGYLSNPKYENGSLYFDQVLYDDMAKDWEQGYYINRSMDLSKRNNKYMVSAMALLGAEAPGIKGLKTFTENNIETIRFTQKINEVIKMEKTFSEGFKEGREAETNALTLKFTDEKEKALNKQEKKFADETTALKTEIADLKAQIVELNKKIAYEGKKRFSDKITEALKKFPETDQEEVKKELLEFSEKMDFETFTKVVDMKNPEKIEFADKKKIEFADKKEKLVNTANKI